MRLVAPTLLIVTAWATQLSAQPTASGDGAAPPTHPEEVAWMDEGEQGYLYRRFPGGQRLYYNDRDPRGRSTCYEGCAAAWPPVPAPADAKPVGPWSVVVRKDGSRQWALKGRPIYTRFHDSPEKPTADGYEGVWHVLPYISRERVAACAAAPGTC
jgi:predicted lipoprotein with Yx(FWY)xxD motif